MEFKGTKGKWKAERHIHEKCGDYLILSENRFQVAVADNEYIRNYQETKANAQLIAHAPEILEKLSICKVMFSKGKRLTTTDMAIMVDEIKGLLTRATTI